VVPDGKTSLDEGHGLSRAVDALITRRLQPLRYGFQEFNRPRDFAVETQLHESLGKDVPQGLKPSSAAVVTAQSKAHLTPLE
jgi:hypothetical protein